MGWFTDVEEDASSLFYTAYTYRTDGVTTKTGPTTFSFAPAAGAANKEITLWAAVRDSNGAESDRVTINVKVGAVPPDKGGETKEGFIEEADGWYYYINNEPAAAGFYEVDGLWRAVGDGGRLYIAGFHEIDGVWRYILNGGILSPPGIYQIDIYWRYILDGGILAEQGFYETDGVWRYVLNGAIVAPAGWYDNLDGHRRYAADGGLLLPEGWHTIDGEEHYILNGSIPASGWVEVDGVLIQFDEYGVPL
jgi:glucan-binding YG repeat protein